MYKINETEKRVLTALGIIAGLFGASTIASAITAKRFESTIAEKAKSATTTYLESGIQTEEIREIGNRVAERITDDQVKKAVNQAAEDNVRDIVKSEVRNEVAKEVKSTINDVLADTMRDYDVKRALRDCVSEAAENYVRNNADSFIRREVTSSVEKQMKNIGDVVRTASYFKSM